MERSNAHTASTTRSSIGCSTNAASATISASSTTSSRVGELLQLNRPHGALNGQTPYERLLAKKKPQRHRRPETLHYTDVTIVTPRRTPSELGTGVLIGSFAVGLFVHAQVAALVLVAAAAPAGRIPTRPHFVANFWLGALVAIVRTQDPLPLSPLKLGQASSQVFDRRAQLDDILPRKGLSPSASIA